MDDFAVPDEDLTDPRALLEQVPKAVQGEQTARDRKRYVDLFGGMQESSPQSGAANQCGK
ncbi:MAG: hypothetical protein CM15mP120_22520 [Pseudomonadota bacterium]|nr:MAG: hypothetical protein CM15mP120_22520 [Pseudomonadota bacterium]